MRSIRTMTVIALASAATCAAAQGVYIAPAPRMDPAALQAAEAQALAPKALTASSVLAVPAIDTSNIAAVLNAYTAYYNTAMPAVGFSGSNAGCNPGAISQAFQEWTITRINFLRAMAGVPGSTTLDTTKNANEQAAALIMSANNTLTHAPTAGMLCYSAAGATGASSSNIALGTTDSIPLYMSDPGTGNQVAGHRRWILHSAKNSFGLGEDTDTNAASALYTFQVGSAVSVPNGIPWPPRGYVPLDLFPNVFTSVQRWSFGLPNANFAAANVAVTLNGSPLAVSVVSRTDNGYGDNTIVWEMPSSLSVTAGSTFNVTISGVGNAASTSYSYQIFPFDPTTVVADLSVTQSPAPNPGASHKDVVYTLTATNGGPSPSPVTLTDTIPPGTAFIWASPGCANVAGTVTCSLGTVAGGTSRQVKVVVRPASAGGITNTASVAGSPSDPNAANNSSSSTITVAASPAAVIVPRYRLYSPVTQEHLFTTSLAEYNTLGAQVGTWSQEGLSGNVLDNPGVFNTVTATPYYRLYNTATRWHHWTTDPNEYYTLIQFANWSAEGVDGYILPGMTPGAEQLYRLVYPDGRGLHHWTIDPVEYNALITQFGWVGEGGSGYVVQ